MPTSEQVAEFPADAPVAGAVAGIVAKEDSDAWNALAGAQDAQAYCVAWLDIQCSFMPGAIAALLLLDDGDGHYSTAAVWPDARHDVSYLADTAREALSHRTSFLGQRTAAGADGETLQIGQPIEYGGRLKGVVVIDLRRPAAEPSALLRQLRWGTGWLETLFGRAQREQDGARLARSTLALKILGGTQEHRSFRASALALANELADRLACCRVSVGLCHGASVRLAAVSHSAVFVERSHFAAAIENAMEETADQHNPVALPPTPRTRRRIVLAHEGLARRLGATSIVSVPMSNGVRCIGVILLERDRGEPFDDAAIELLEAVATLVGPGLEVKREANRFLAGRAVDGAGRLWRGLFGRGRPALKLAALAIAGAVAWLALAQADFRVTAKAVVEGAVQRAVTAPYEGYLASAPVRAGDIVEAGQALATIDGRELRLEAARWKSEQEQQRLKYRDALARRDRSQALVLLSAAEQADAQLSLVEAKLARSTIVAPFKGVVVSGDLRQFVGSPIEQGKVLFEITPLESYRVVLEVDERDIVYLTPGQSGSLLLTGLSNDAFPFSVKTITPVATASEGRNHFKVEADMRDSGLQLRPGMEGVGKIVIDRRSQLGIWLRPLTDWFRITAWKWLP